MKCHKCGKEVDGIPHIICEKCGTAFCIDCLEEPIPRKCPRCGH